MQLNKEDSQTILVGVLFGLMITVALWFLAIKPMGAKRKKLETENAALQQEVRTSRQLEQMSDTIEQRYRETRRTLRRAMKEDLPPPANATAWASDVFMAAAVPETIRMELLGINESGTVRIRADRDEPPPLFEDCLFQTEIRAGYHDVGRFLAKVERDNPFARVDGIEMRADPQEDGRLLVTLTCAFPRLTADGFPPEERPSAENPVVKPHTPEK